MGSKLSPIVELMREEPSIYELSPSLLAKKAGERKRWQIGINEKT